MKKFLALALALCMCVCMSATAFAAEIDTSGGSGSTPVSLTSTDDGTSGGDPSGTAMSVTVPTALPIKSVSPSSPEKSHRKKQTNSDMSLRSGLRKAITPLLSVLIPTNHTFIITSSGTRQRSTVRGSSETSGAVQKPSESSVISSVQNIVCL